jgi:hypothetical protein
MEETIIPKWSRVVAIVMEQQKLKNRENEKEDYSSF